MGYLLSEWLNLALRWLHVFAAILWVGQTFLFVRFEQWLADAEAAGAPAGSRPQAWLVHSGGFYLVEKHTLANFVPPRLRWFKWEAALTWLSGFLLLSLVYYAGGLMVDATDPRLAPGVAIGLGIAVLLAGWAVYDLVWQTALGRSEPAAVTILFLLLVALAYGLTRVMPGRAAYIHVGGLLGTIMTANVWMRILPAQRRMLAAVQQGRPPDLTLGARARQRTKHNTYMVVPVVFIMLSSHFPVATYGNRYNWVILAILILVGWGAAARLRRG